MGQAVQVSGVCFSPASFLFQPLYSPSFLPDLVLACLLPVVGRRCHKVSLSHASMLEASCWCVQ